VLGIVPSENSFNGLRPVINDTDRSHARADAPKATISNVSRIKRMYGRRR
jgi:hypothetical protein